MKKILILIFAFTINSIFLSAQDCVRDSSIIGTDDIFSPLLWTSEAPFYNLQTACIGEVYQQSLTLNVNAIMSAINDNPINYVRIDSMNPFDFGPIGLTYSCDPPNCLFLTETIGCILLHGTPTFSNPAPDTIQLNFQGYIDLPVFGEIPQILPGNWGNLLLILNPNDSCVTTKTEEPQPVLLQLTTSPNPFTGQTQVEIQSRQAGNYRFEVFDFLGHVLFSENIILTEGLNRIPYDGQALVSGIYFISISGKESKSVQQLVKI